MCRFVVEILSPHVASRRSAFHAVHKQREILSLDPEDDFGAYGIPVCMSLMNMVTGSP